MAEEKRLLSLRGEEQLLKLHKHLNHETRDMDQLFNRFLAALRACDLNTQQQYFGEYLNGVAAQQLTSRKLVSFLESRFDLSIEQEKGSLMAERFKP